MPPTDDFWGAAVKQIYEHWVMLAALAVAARYGMPWGMKLFFSPGGQGEKIFQTQMHAFYNNGGGDKVRAIVKSENEAQSAHNREAISAMMKQALDVHTLQEREEVRRALQDFRGEITDKYALPAARKVRAK